MTVFIAFLGREFDSIAIMCLLINQAAPGELTSRHLGSPGTDLAGELAWHHLTWRWFCDICMSKQSCDLVTVAV